MIKEPYYSRLKSTLKVIADKKKIQLFLFGSALNRDFFYDIDVGLMGDIDENEIMEMREYFIDSDLPYFVDIVNFNNVSTSFKENVFNNKIIWIKH